MEPGQSPLWRWSNGMGRTVDLIIGPRHNSSVSSLLAVGFGPSRFLSTSASSSQKWDNKYFLSCVHPKISETDNGLPFIALRILAVFKCS